MAAPVAKPAGPARQCEEDVAVVRSKEPWGPRFAASLQRCGSAAQLALALPLLSRYVSFIPLLDPMFL